MDKPKLGDVVHFYYKVGDEPQGPFLGLVTHVHNDTEVNLAAYASEGYLSGAELSIPLVEPDGVGELNRYCHWPPPESS